MAFMAFLAFFGQCAYVVIAAIRSIHGSCASEFRSETTK